MIYIILYDRFFQYMFKDISKAWTEFSAYTYSRFWFVKTRVTFKTTEFQDFKKKQLKKVFGGGLGVWEKTVRYYYIFFPL